MGERVNAMMMVGGSILARGFCEITPPFSGDGQKKKKSKKLTHKELMRKRLLEEGAEAAVEDEDEEKQVRDPCSMSLCMSITLCGR